MYAAAVKRASMAALFFASFVATPVARAQSSSVIAAATDGVARWTFPYTATRVDDAQCNVTPLPQIGPMLARGAFQVTHP